MNTDFYDKLANSNASTNCRNGLKDFILQNPHYLKGVVDFATDLTNKNQFKGVWMLEMIAETHPELLLPLVDQIAETAASYKHESAIRGISRAILFLTTSKKIKLTEAQEEKVIEISLDRLIGKDKVAPKVFAMYALCHFSKKYDWIADELHNIIEKDFASQSAGYKAAARETLRKISR